MIIDTITLIIGLSITLTTILALLLTPFWHKIKALPVSHSNTPLQAVSILIPTHDNAPELKRNLPIFLQQEYAGEYRVIIVADKGDHDTEDLIKQLQSTYKNLYATYLPDSSRYMSRTKLAITLGVKAAHTEWITITDPTCKPQDEHWLASWAENMNDDSDFIMGYVAMDETCPAIWRFEHALLANQCLSSAQRGKAWATNCPNIALRNAITAHALTHAQAHGSMKKPPAKRHGTTEKCIFVHQGLNSKGIRATDYMPCSPTSPCTQAYSPRLQVPFMQLSAIIGYYWESLSSICSSSS